MPRATWTWTFDLPPGELWPVLADTNRFNEAMGLPPYVLEETPQPNGTVLRRGRAGGGLHAGMGGEALRVDRGPAFPPVPRVHQGAVPPLRAGVRSRARRQGRIARQLRPGVRAAHPDGPPVRRPPGQAGRRRGGEAHPRSRRLRQGRAPDLVRHRAARAARGRARARRGAGRRDRSQPLRQRARPPARRPRADRHGDRSRPSQAQEAGARSAGAATRRHRGLSRRHARGPAHHEMGPAVHQLPRRQAHGLGALRAAARRALPVLQHRLRPRLREERRALLCARAGGAAAGRRRLLPLGPDGHAARRRPAPAGAGREAQRDPRPAGRLLSPAHAASRRASSTSSIKAARSPACASTAKGVEALPPGQTPAPSPSPTTRASSWPR